MISRRTFLALPLAAPLGTLSAAGSSAAHAFQHDHVLGTSLDLIVWSEESAQARRAHGLVLDEIGRLAAILNTRDPNSEIGRLQHSGLPSPDLAALFALYAAWETRSGGVLSIRPAGPNTPLNVDALGKAFIVERAARKARLVSGVHGLVLNVGGDVVTWGCSCAIGVGDPAMPYDNAPPLTRVALRDRAVATSGPDARGAHLIDGRTGAAPPAVATTTVVAGDLVTANALATALCILDAGSGLSLIARTPGAEALRVSADGVVRSSGFAALEQTAAPAPVPAWPAGFQLTISFVLPNLGPRALRPFLAAWVEDESGRLVRIITLWGVKEEWHKELTTFWTMTGGSRELLFPATRPTRSPGKYRLVWDGRDTTGMPVPTGAYRVVVEASRERGEYSRRAATIACRTDPVTVAIDATTNWTDLTIQYAPKP